VKTFDSQLHAYVLEVVPTAIALLRGPAFVFEFLNPACQRLAPGKPMLGRTVEEAWPEAWPTVGPLLRRVLETGEPFHADDAPFEVFQPDRPPTRIWVSFSYQRIDGPEGRPDRIFITALDRTAQVRDRERGRLLADMARALSHGASLEDVVRPALEGGVRLLGGTEGALLLYDAGARLLRGERELQSKGRAGVVVSLDALPHARQAVEGFQPQFWTRATAAGEEFAWAERYGLAACLVVPLVADGRCAGVLQVGYAHGRAPPHAEELGLAADLAGQCAVALQRARLAEARDEERSLYEHVLQAAPAGVCVIDGETLRVRWANRAFQEFLEEPFRTDGVEGRHLPELVPQAEEGGLVDLFRRAAATGRPHVESEYEHRGFSRGTTWWRWSLLPRERPGGRRDLTLLALDVTEQVRARQLAEAQAAASARELARLEALIEAMSEGVLLADRFGNVALVNGAAARMHRFASSAEYQHHLRDFPATFELRAPGADAPLPLEEWPLGRLMRGLGPFDGYEVEVLRRDTGERFVFAYGGATVPDAAGEPDLYVLTVRDVTADKLAAAEKARLLQEVRQQSAALEGVISSMADGLVLFDAGGRLTRFNEAARQISGHAPEHLGQTFAERASALDLETPDGEPVRTSDLPVARALRGETTRGAYVGILRQAGRRQWLSISSAPLRAPDGTILGAVATFTDVTALRDLQEQQEDVLRTLSHDVRTPLTVIVNQAEILRRSLVGGVAERRLASIAASAKRITAMINDLVEIAKMRGGRLAVDPEALDFDAWAREILERHHGPLPVERVVLDVPDGLPPVRADPLRLERILLNLLSNALKYSAGEVALRVRRQGSTLAIQVADRGQGIVPEDLPRIFDRFFRSPDAQRVEGLGLGLYVARELAEAHGGRLTAESPGPGGGATFTLFIPLA
jgi:PAS domain S-box-containing protein